MRHVVFGLLDRTTGTDYHHEGHTMTKASTVVSTAPLSVEAANTVTETIRTTGKAIVANRTAFAKAIKQAKAGDAHVTLGFKSWTDYVATVFTDVKGLGSIDREYLTAFMAGEGMSSRAISRITGASQSTATRAIKKAVETGTVKADRTVKGTDGKDKPATTKASTKKAPVKKAPVKKTSEAERFAPVAGSDTDLLRATALSILAELSDRWTEGDEAAERAIMEIGDAAVMTV